MIARQMRRSKLERQNREGQRRVKSDRYAMFAEEFGDVFEELHDREASKKQESREDLSQRQTKL